jgi:hypothetical protein
MLNYPLKTVTVLLIFSLLMVVVFVTTQGFDGENTQGPDRSGNDTIYAVKPFKLPDTVSFAGEEMPLQNFDTRESLERELLTSAYRHSSTILVIKRAARYFPIIEKILKENDIPDDFKYVALAESELSNVVSPVGATGFWQIMQSTGREEGLEINNEIDERYSIEKSTVFACNYFRKSYDKYGNWTLAAASYNGGRRSLDDQIGIQKQTNYYDLLLTEETARYIFRVVAYKLIVSDPAGYGFMISKDDLYPELQYYEVKVDTSVADLAVFSHSFGTNYKLLKLLNPWLRKPYLTNKNGREYLIKIPVEGARENESEELSD